MASLGAGTRVAAAARSGTDGLQVRGLTASYDEKPVLLGFDLDIRAGEIVALLGANGSGKSTALRCLAGLREADGGTALLDGTPLASARGPRRTAVVFQAPHLVRRRTALDNVAAGALGRLSALRSLSPLLFPSELRVEALRCLDRVGLADRAADRAGRLSGGQQQRVAVARALCQRAPVLLADEPVSALDPAAADQVMELLRDLAHAEGLAVLVVLHQPDLARSYADRVVGLKAGAVAFDAPAAGLPSDVVADLYGEVVPVQDVPS